MGAPGWLSQRLTDVPTGNEWLGAEELRVLSGLKFARRRADWRLGRWTAKTALSRWLGVTGDRIEVLAAGDGAPEAWLDGEPAGLSISLSHRGERALAVVGEPPLRAGCDLELVEPRSPAFLLQWLADAERRRVLESPEAERALMANLIWAAKEAAAKVRREGLRLDVRGAIVTADATCPAGEWHPLRVAWSDGVEPTRGWWRAEPGWVMVVAGQPAPDVPQLIAV